MVSHRFQRLVGGLIVVALSISQVPTGSACTGIRIKPKDGSIVYARTLEFGIDLHSNIVVIPRGKEYVGTAPGGKPGLKWKAKFGMVGVNAFGLPLVTDGLNEQGLAMGVFYFPGYTKYQAVDEGEAGKTLSPEELATYVLGTCSNVAEAARAINDIKVGDVALKDVKMGQVALKEFDLVLPVHYIVHDKNGRCIVIEYADGHLKIHDNPLGVMSNAPTFDWHVTNLRNYVNLTVTNVPPRALSGLTAAAFGQGSGMHGLPGDFTPPSRFVQAAVFSISALPVQTAREGVLQAFHILNQFDIPKGASREKEQGKQIAEYTFWTSAADLSNLRYYFHTFDNRRIRMIDLKAMDLDARDVKTIPMAGDEDIEDVSGKGKSDRAEGSNGARR